MRKIDAFPGGNPARPFPDPSAAAFLNDVVRCFPEQREHRLEYRSLQTRPVSLDGHEVIKPGLPADGLGRFPLGVGSVHSEQGGLALWYFSGFQDGLRLRNLVGTVGHPDLRNSDRLVVKHRGEQGHFIVLVSPCPAQHLPVERDDPVTFIVVFTGLNENPCAAY